ncbi:MAG TPA: TA system VapC family ribonuclease toxin [Candidatus Binatia bacterium]|jgi:toxin-antitoxin system PIN domain toxin|nr:TA system VapC family ribonuclease toxin [Candidatus Binatia bacterium]
MSYALDVNVLLYASDERSPYHSRARRFLDECSVSPEVLCLGWPTVMGYLRIATHPRVFVRPLTRESATANIDALLGLPHVRVLAEEEGFWTVYRKVADPVHVRGNLVPDAHLAALLLQHGVRTLYTNDRDFRKFDFLETRNPLAK